MKYIIEIEPLADRYVVAAKDPGDGKVKKVLTLNESGAYMLRLLADGRSADEIPPLVAGHYGITSEQAVADTQTFISQMRHKGLL